jgi:hexokinase
MERVKEFLRDQKLQASDIDLDKLVQDFLDEMKRGLEGDESSLRMIPTYIEADNEFLTETPVLAIDAGGTNFRAALITFKDNGETEIGEIHHHTMPGLDREISADEFFKTMAGFIAPLIDKTDRIGFCFSYATEIFPNKDGKLLQFSKEVKAPEVIGMMIGETLLKTLGTPDKEIVLLNDTVATLLAGKSSNMQKEYESYVGFILGTGTNTCYIEQNANILKSKDFDPEQSQIINTESGNFTRMPRSEVDIAFDDKTRNPGEGMFEKMFSGGYFGGLCLDLLKTAAGEGLFSDEAAEKVKAIDDLASEQANEFAHNRNAEGNILAGCFSDGNDASTAFLLIDTLIDRAAVLVAANLAAMVLKSGKGKHEKHPILITIEGTTFYKLYRLRERFESVFSGYLSGDNKRYVEFTDVEQSSLVGAALAGLIE